MDLTDFKYEIKMQNMTSDGGVVILTPGNYGEVTLSLPKNRDRGDCRLSIKDFIKVAKVLEAMEKCRYE